jgi:long-subunit acyl-CoA synthetase (AMP-forming)
LRKPIIGLKFMITLHTSGSTKEPKLIHHKSITEHVQRSIKEIGLTKHDRVLNVFPANVIANYTVTAMPALTAGAHLFSTNFDPYNYVKSFNEFQPTVISLIPRHYEILSKTKGWHELDMKCVRYMVVGSGAIDQAMIDAFRNKGVETVANWYGLTEMPPPVFVGYNTSSFDFTPKDGYAVEFTAEGECVINGFHTGDIFDLETKTFLHRLDTSNKSTWKNDF